MAALVAAIIIGGGMLARHRHIWHGGMRMLLKRFVANYN